MESPTSETKFTEKEMKNFLATAATLRVNASVIGREKSNKISLDSASLFFDLNE